MVVCKRPLVVDSPIKVGSFINYLCYGIYCTRASRGLLSCSQKRPITSRLRYYYYYYYY